MQIDQIRAFVRCAELGSLSAAAKAEAVPKSTQSRLLRALETTVGVPLFNRSSRGMALTQDGLTLLAHGRKILDDIETAAAAVRPSAAAPSGVVRLTAPYTFGVTYLSPMLPAFLAAYPGIDVHIELTSRNVDLTAEGYDLAVRIGTPPADMVARRLMGNPLRLCASPDYLERYGAPAHPDDLAAHRLLLIGSPRARAALRLWRGGGSHLVDPPPKLLSSDPAVILRSTLAGVGIGQIPMIIAKAEIQRGALIPVLSEWTMPEADISLIHAAGPLPRVRALADFIHDRIDRERAGSLASP